jgi:hypothetical protein
MWYVKGKVFTRGVLEVDDNLMLEIKEVVSTNAQLPGIYGVIVWANQNNVTGINNLGAEPRGIKPSPRMKAIFSFTFTDSNTLSLKSGDKHAELKRSE